MIRLFERLLCRLGFHDWEYQILFRVKNYGLGARVCLVCRAVKVIPHGA